METIILRHRRENLKKCSLSGLETRSDLKFLIYPKDPFPNLDGYIALKVGAPELTPADRDYGLFLIDGTWRYAAIMENQILKTQKPIFRSIPKGFVTSYPRKQTGCADPKAGLASVEALYIAHLILGKETKHLLDHYYWKDEFLRVNTTLHMQLFHVAFA